MLSNFPDDIRSMHSRDRSHTPVCIMPKPRLSPKHPTDGQQSLGCCPSGASKMHLFELPWQLFDLTYTSTSNSSESDRFTLKPKFRCILQMHPAFLPDVLPVSSFNNTINSPTCPHVREAHIPVLKSLPYKLDIFRCYGFYRE